MRIDDDLDEDLNRESTRTNPGGSQNPTPDDGGGNGPEPKPEDKDKPTIKPQDGQSPVVTPGKGELPEDVIKALKEAGIPMTGENPTIEDLEKALKAQGYQSIANNGVIINIGVYGSLGVGGGTNVENGILIGISPTGDIKVADYSKVAAGIMFGGSVGTGGTFGITFGSSNPSVFSGNGNQFGASAGNVWGVGADISIDANNKTLGLSVSTGPTAKIPMPFEAHAMVTNTNVGSRLRSY